MILKDKGKFSYGFDVVLSDNDIKNFSFEELPLEKKKVMSDNRQKMNKFTMLLFLYVFIVYMIIFTAVFFLNGVSRSMIFFALGVTGVIFFGVFLLFKHIMNDATKRINLPHYVEYADLIERLELVPYMYRTCGISDTRYMYPVKGKLKSNGYETTFYVSEETYKSESLSEIEFVFYKKPNGVYESSPDSTIPMKILGK